MSYVIFEYNGKIEKIGEGLGYVFSYFLFTTILFFILVILNKFPESWSYFHIMGIVILIAATGATIRRLLK